MLTEDIIRQQLYQGAETKSLDYKEGFNWLTCSPDTRLGLVKDVLGMSNTQDGGVILIGVEDGSYRLSGLTAQQVESFDQTRIADAIKRYADPWCAVQLYKLEIDNKKIIALEVPEFKDVPHLCKMDGNSSASGKTILRRGALYVRTERATTEEVGSAEEMRALLGRALRARGDSIISSIRALLAGSPPSATMPNVFERQIKESDEFFGALDFAQEGKWMLSSHPINFENERIGDPREIGRRLERSRVSLRGWSFPRLRSDDISNFGEGVESSFSGRPLVVMHKEAFRAYDSGLFMWRGVFWEDGEPLPSGGNDLTFIGAIWQQTEFFLFLSRYYDFLDDNEGISIRVEAIGLKNRELTARDARISWEGGYTAKANSFVFQKTVRAVELKTAPMDIALECSRKLLLLFNWNSVTDDIIKNWQQRLLNRTY
jgi:hypothetical protein